MPLSGSDTCRGFAPHRQICESHFPNFFLKKFSARAVPFFQKISRSVGSGIGQHHPRPSYQSGLARPIARDVRLGDPLPDPSVRVLLFHDGSISQRHPLPHFSIKTPAPALGFRNSSATGLRFWTRRQSTVEAAARFPELYSDHTSPARSGLGAAARSIFASRSLPEVRDQGRISNHCNPSKTP
jgi:hypothetical protein